LHPALRTWRDDASATLVRALAYIGGLALLSLAAAQLLQPTAIKSVDRSPSRPEWIEIARPHAAFSLSIPEAAEASAHYAIRRHATGNGRKDLLSLGQADSFAPYLHVEIYRPGGEIENFASPADVISAGAVEFEPSEVSASDEPLATKFGPISIVTFVAKSGTPRRCIAFVRAYGDPRLQISGWFCQGGDSFISRDTLACALDRLSLLSAGSEPKTGALFAQVELNRSFCGHRSPLMAPTPKHRALWAAQSAKRPPQKLLRRVAAQ
jgi:hypothetical protein